MYCQPRAVDFHPAIDTKHLIANLLSMTKPEPLNLLQLGAQPALMGPMKAIARQLPNLMMPPDRFQGNEHALGPSGSLPWDLQCEGLYLLIQTSTGCIFQLKVPPLHTVKLLKQDIGTAILESPAVFEFYFREEALNDQESCMSMASPVAACFSSHCNPRPCLTKHSTQPSRDIATTPTATTASCLLPCPLPSCP